MGAVEAVLWLAAVLAAFGVIGKATATAWRRVVGTSRKPGWARRAIRLVDDLTGLPAEVAAVKADVVALKADLGVVKAEVKNNGGSSLKDSTHRIERALGLPEPTAHPSTNPTPCLPKEP